MTATILTIEEITAKLTEAKTELYGYVGDAHMDILIGIEAYVIKLASKKKFSHTEYSTYKKLKGAVIVHVTKAGILAAVEHGAIVGLLDIDAFVGPEFDAAKKVIAHIAKHKAA